jgi:hypothetical protein
MRKSASNAGPANMAVTIKTDPAERKYPHAPIAAGGKAVADGCKASIAAESHTDRRVPDQSEADCRHGRSQHACSTAAAGITGNTGIATNATALTAMSARAMDDNSRSDRAASTTIPPGIWPTSAARLPTVRTRPMSTCVHFWVVR